jgi:hypothetical protein
VTDRTSASGGIPSGPLPSRPSLKSAFGLWLVADTGPATLGDRYVEAIIVAGIAAGDTHSRFRTLLTSFEREAKPRRHDAAR